MPDRSRRAVFDHHHSLVKDKLAIRVSAVWKRDNRYRRHAYTETCPGHVLMPLLLWLAIPPAFPADLPLEHLHFFEEKIRPVLVDHCYKCHSAQAEKLKGGLFLDTRAGWEKGGDSGEPAIVPGRPEASLLVKAVRHEDAELTMPPKREKLPDSIITDLEAWVKMGAPDPRTGTVELRRADKTTWWSLQPLAARNVSPRGGLPEAWTRNPIDGHVFAKLAEKGLAPNPPADPRVLIRRMYYDLIGLPPVETEVADFVQAAGRDREAAIAQLVDRLLASPHYGEQWGRHWLDVVRFGESVGFEKNTVIDTAWPFRDYVIRSLNEDKPFDRFIVEHLAGDVIGKGDPQVEIGSAFLVIGPHDNVVNEDLVAQANIRAATLDEMINATATAFLGLTVSCARCHDHKFDPIPTEDYYRLRAAFEGVKHGERVVATEEQKRRFRERVEPLDRRKAELAAKRRDLEETILAHPPAVSNDTLAPPPAPDYTEERFTAHEARVIKLRILATAGNPASGVGARMDEFEVWSAGSEPRNVALASAGAIAEGAVERQAGDFIGAYGVGQVNDGKFGVRWLVGNPAELTITLPRAERIDRVSFSNLRHVKKARDNRRDGLLSAVAEYEVLTSMDGVHWTIAATSQARQPLSEKHAKQRRLQAAPEAERGQLETIKREFAEIEKRLAAIPPLPKVWCGQFEAVKEPTRVHKGGDPAKALDIVVPASLKVLERTTTPFSLPPDAPESQRRLALAEWIVSYGNPLTPRVLANRVWHYHFGTGLVDTPGDFGFLGSRPTNPELLDELARQLHAAGWRLKPLHRLILLSLTYQQSGAFRADAAKADQEARLLWRFPPRRLSAEEIRDTMLAVAGKLDLRPGGPGFRLYRYLQDNVSTYVPLDTPGPETYRRAVYHQNARAAVVDLLTDFDLPDNAFPAPRRTGTTSPLQALTLLNHRFTLDMAAALAERMEGSDAAAVRRAYGCALQREPTSIEQSAAAELIAAHGTRAFCRALLNTSELIYLE